MSHTLIGYLVKKSKLPLLIFFIFMCLWGIITEVECDKKRKKGKGLVVYFFFRVYP